MTDIRIEWLTDSFDCDQAGCSGHRTAEPLRRCIIAKPLDPLARAWLEAWPGMPEKDAIEEAGLLLAAVEKSGGKIVWGEE
jgi:hypothetical protein